MTESQVRALFLLANIELLNLWQIENKYWPSAYVEEIKNSPWWLVKTELGIIEIGWRKRVISINWEDTGVKAIVTEDEVTKNETLVHAYSYIKALEYLIALKLAMKKHIMVIAKPVLEAPVGI
jgi:hypothetical protein